MPRHIRTLRAAVALLVSALWAAAPAATLPRLNLDLEQTSVSGISSGGYMAVQFAVAHSEMVAGVGVFAGGPYRCAAGGAAEALGPCMQGIPVRPTRRRPPDASTPPAAWPASGSGFFQASMTGW